MFERKVRIELTPTDWKSVILPLNYSRNVYLWRDLNPHALASDPKSDVSANSTTQAFYFVPEEGLEPPRLTASHFECDVTAYSTIRAYQNRRHFNYTSSSCSYLQAIIELTYFNLAILYPPFQFSMR